MGTTGRVALTTASLVVAVAGSVLLVGYTNPPASAKKPVCTATGISTPSVTIPASYVHLNVINATQTVGLAARVATALSWRGFQVISAASDSPDDPRQSPAYAEIRYGTGGYQIALTLAAQVPHATVYDDGRSNPSVDLVLGPSFTLATVPPPAAHTITLNVFNTTATPHLATNVAHQMRARGFRIKQVGNDPRRTFNPNQTAIVRYGPRGEPAARRVALSVKGAKLVLDGRTNTSIDLVLSAKFTALLTTAQATTPALPKPDPSCP